MAELLQSLGALSWSLPLLGAACALRDRRTRLLLLGAFLLLTLLSGAVLGALSLPGDLLALPGWTGLADAVLLLGLWALFGALAAAAAAAGGGAWLPGPPLLGAVLCGALLGEVAGSLLCMAGATTPLSRARLALAASAGGLFGRLGDPTVLLLSAHRPDALFILTPLGLLCALVALPGPPLPSSSTEGRGQGWRGGGVLLVGLLTALGTALAGSSAWLPLLAGCVGMAALARNQLRTVDLSLPLRALLLGGLLILVAAGGLPELAALGLETVQEILGAWLKPLLALAFVLLAVLTDSLGVALLAEAVVDRGLSLSRPGLVETMAAAAAIGGLTPLLLAGPGALRAGAVRWLAQVAIVAFWAALVL